MQELKRCAICKAHQDSAVLHEPHRIRSVVGRVRKKSPGNHLTLHSFEAKSPRLAFAANRGLLDIADKFQAARCDRLRCARWRIEQLGAPTSATGLVVSTLPQLDFAS